jgi:gas vesicle protein
MRRLAFGAALGSLAAYLFDPKMGAERRERFHSLWQDNRETAVQAGQRASRAFESAAPVARRMTKAVGRGDWAQVFERRRRSFGLPKLIGAAAVGGALMYFLDPVRGAERRSSTLVAGRKAVNKVVETAKTARRRASGSSVDSGSRVKSQVG